MTAPILIWEQHAGRAPRQLCHTHDLDAVPDVIRSWVGRFARRPVTAHRTNDDVLVLDISGRRPVPVATLWIEYPDELIPAPAWLDRWWARARAGRAG